MKISYCTFLIDNYQKVKQNFIFNLNAIKYFNGNVEWVILNIDNGSAEFIETDTYIKKYSDYFIKNNLLKYVTIKTNKFSVSAFKNICHYLANNDFVINFNIKADISLLDTEILLNINTENMIYKRGDSDIISKDIVGVNKNIFKLIGGYNEYLPFKCYESEDLIERLKLLGLEYVVFTYQDCRQNSNLDVYNNTRDKESFEYDFNKNKLISDDFLSKGILKFDNPISSLFEIN